MATQRATFYHLLDEQISFLKSGNEKYCLTSDLYIKVVAALSLKKGDSCTYGTKFKAWCKGNFKLQQIGSKQLLFCTKSSCPVITKEEYFDTILKCHEKVGHSGRDRTWNEVKSNNAGVKYAAIDVFLKTCSVCLKRQPAKCPPCGKPIIDLEFLSRLQIDLIDFRSRPDGDFRWVLHARDHFTKFSWTYPLVTKTASEVAEMALSRTGSEQRSWPR